MNPRQFLTTLLTLTLLTACSDSSDRTSPPVQPPQTLTILVTNDDGIGAPGIDTLVNGLIELEDVVVEVVAPAENRSGSSDKTTEGEVVYEDSATVSGYMGVAVYGYPADTVNVALGELGITPHLVVSGVNRGQNAGRPAATASGTVGAARTAARSGIPAVATSASGFPELADYDAATALVVEWIMENREALIGGSASAEYVTNFNVPGCTAGQIRELVAVPLADSVPGGVNFFRTDCSVEPESPPTNDVDALVKGHAAVTDVPLEL